MAADSGATGAGYVSENATDFHIGERVEARPATGVWMQGDRFGVVVEIGRKRVRVKMEPSGRTLNFWPWDLMHVESGRSPTFA
jgi:hypothetical protein